MKSPVPSMLQHFAAILLDVFLAFGLYRSISAYGLAPKLEIWSIFFLGALVYVLQVLFFGSSFGLYSCGLKRVRGYGILREYPPNIKSGIFGVTGYTILIVALLGLVFFSGTRYQQLDLLGPNLPQKLALFCSLVLILVGFAIMRGFRSALILGFLAVASVPLFLSQIVQELDRSIPLFVQELHFIKSFYVAKQQLVTEVVIGICWTVTGLLTLSVLVLGAGISRKVG